jgi:hypothetical protein
MAQSRFAPPTSKGRYFIPGALLSAGWFSETCAIKRPAPEKNKARRKT